MPQTKQTLQNYYDGWIVSCTGRTSRGIRAETLKDYAKQMRLYVLPKLGRKRLAEIGPADVKRLAADLSSEGLSASSVRLALSPLKVLFATAFEDDAIRRNPAAGVRIAQQTATGDEPEKLKALTPEQVATLLSHIPENQRLLVEVLAQTGLRIGEALALTWGDIDLGKQRLRVRRRWYKGAYATPKSRFGKRQVPLTRTLAQRLWSIRGADDELVFGTDRGTPIDQTNYYNRIFKPAAKRAGVPWATFHTLRHTCASVLFNGTKDPETGERVGALNAKQVQAWLGHHAASFTLDTYIHLLEDDLADAPQSLDAMLGGATEGQQNTPKHTETVKAPEVGKALNGAGLAIPA